MVEAPTSQWLPPPPPTNPHPNPRAATRRVQPPPVGSSSLGSKFHATTGRHTTPHGGIRSAVGLACPPEVRRWRAQQPRLPSALVLGRVPDGGGGEEAATQVAVGGGGVILRLADLVKASRARRAPPSTPTSATSSPSTPTWSRRRHFRSCSLLLRRLLPPLRIRQFCPTRSSRWQCCWCRRHCHRPRWRRRRQWWPCGEADAAAGVLEKRPGGLCVGCVGRVSACGARLRRLLFVCFSCRDGY